MIRPDALKCGTCGEMKPVSEYFMRLDITGLPPSAKCRDCAREYKREYKRANADKVNAAKRARRQAKKTEDW